MNHSTGSAKQATRSQVRSLLWIMAAFNLIVAALAAWTLVHSRRQYIERAEGTTHNLALVLEQTLLAHVRQIDLVLQSVRDEAERRDAAFSPADRLAGVAAHVRSQLARVPMLHGLHTTDAAGRLEQREGLPPEALGEVSGQPFFRELQERPQAGLFISSPSRGGPNGGWVITLARRMERPQGTFRGVVFATVTLDQLTEELAQVDVGRRGSISLRGAHLELLARYPAYQGQERAIGDARISGDYLTAVRSGSRVSHFTTHSVLDGQTRTYTFRKIQDPTFYILVGLSQAEYLQAWRREAFLSGSAVAGLLALSLGIGWMARAAWRRQAEVQDLIAAQEAKFRLLAENALDAIWTADPDGTLTYISPSVTSQRGFRPEELVGRSFKERQVPGADPGPLQRLLDCAHRAEPGAQPFEGERLELDLPRKDGQSFRAEIRIRLLWDEAGRLLGFQGATRDITERTRMEAERDRLIQELTLALAEVKHLKGMLPICGHCKKIRDDHGYWKNLESYLSEHTEATFTHGVCPDCAQELRREFQARKEQKDQD